MNIIKKFLAHNWWATIYFNFRMLPFGQAIKLPIDIYHSVRFESLKGRVVINTPHIYRGVIKFGGRGSDMFARTQSVIHIEGTLKLGKGCEIGAGVSTIVLKNGVLDMSDNVRIGALSKIYCEELVKIGEQVDLSWESQIFDTNFHYIENLCDKSIDKRSSPVTIGSNNWFGNRVTIMKGCVIGNNMIVASNSLCNRDYSNIAEYSLLAGTPAKLIKSGVRRLFPQEEDMYIQKVMRG